MEAKQNLVVGLLLLLLSSCSTSKLAIQVLEVPNEYPGPIEVGIYDRTDYSKVQISTFQKGVLSDLQTNDLNVLGDRGCGLLYLLADEGGLEPFKLPNGTFDSLGYFGDHPLTFRVMEPVCAVYGLDALLVIEGISSSVDSDGSLRVAAQTEVVYGNPSSEGFENERIETSIYARLYDCQTGEVMHEGQSASTLVFDESDNTYNKVYQRLPIKDASLSSGVEVACVDWAKEVFPYWKEEERSFFYYGSPRMVEAGHHALFGEWNQAKTIWEEVVRGNSNKLAAKAAFNLALAAEVNGDLTGAIHWATIARDRYELEDAQPYLEVLESRKEKYRGLMDRQ